MKTSLNIAFLNAATLFVALDLQAATITVTNTADSGSGSLRAALKNANDGDTINFSLSSPATIVLTSDEVLVSKNVTILGPGVNRLAVSGNHSNRVIHIATDVIATIAGLKIVDGFATGRTFTASSGGGIYNDHATLTVSNCVLSGNAAVESGGAIFNNGAGSNPNTSSATLTLVNCTLDGNSTHRGGGIYSDGTGNQATVTILNSTLSNNSGDYYGGGIGTDPGTTLTVRNSTFSGNATGGTFGGGGISGYASAVTVTGSTFTGNTANGGAGHGNCIYTEVGTLSIGSTILNSIGNNIYNSPVGAGTVVSLGYNLRNSADILLTNANDRVGSPMLGPLQDNGGPTLTCALLPGSPAIDRGKNLDASVNDQRGSARTYDDLTTTNAMGGDGTDIGAFEVQRTIQLAIESDGSGGLFVRFTGEPDVTYRLQRAASVTGAWANLATNTAPASGLIEYHETTPPPGQAFYRTVQP